MRRLTLTVTPEQAGRTVRSLLRRELRMADGAIARVKTVPDGICLNGAHARTVDRVAAGDTLTVRIDDKRSGGRFTPVAVPLDILYEDADLIEEATALMDEFEKTYEELRISTLLTGEYDKDDAILTLHAGAGGTESCDWAGMLYRMFTRWAGKKGYGTEVLDYLDGDEAGIKSVTVKITGMNAYGYLRSEKGVHRLVRISPFNAAGKRQTSFASCDVMPDIKDDIEVEIADEDIRIDTYRASGAGGQHINKTDSAIRITHLPTGIVVQCQNERSQHKNKDQAMKMLKTKLYLLKQQQHLEKLSDIRGDVGDNGWGNQIRSYVLQPYTMVKDHRTNFESGNPSAVLDGDLDGFMNAYLAWDNNSKKEEN